MAGADCDLPVRMALHPALIETIHMTLKGAIEVEVSEHYIVIVAFNDKHALNIPSQ